VTKREPIRQKSFVSSAALTATTVCVGKANKRSPTFTQQKEAELMNRIALPTLGILLAIAPTTVSAAGSMDAMTMPKKLSVSATFNPAPPRQGMETITITVKDAMKMPVKDAAVKIATNMPAMSMSGPTLTAHSNGNGTYVAKANLNAATTWAFDITASSGAQKGSAHLTADVK
jgi:hypothetical protein